MRAGLSTGESGAIRNRVVGQRYGGIGRPVRVAGGVVRFIRYGLPPATLVANYFNMLCLGMVVSIV